MPTRCDRQLLGSLTVALHAAGYADSVITPLWVHHFAKTPLRRAERH